MRYNGPGDTMAFKVTRRTIEMTWNPEARLAVLRFNAETHATGKDAVILVEALSGWIGTDGEPFGLLGDGTRLASVDAKYRSEWSRFLRRHRGNCRIAFFNMGPVVRIAAEMFRIGTGVQLKAFAEEAEARSWLREKGIPG